MISIKVFFLLCIFLGANCRRSYRKERACKKAGQIVNGSFKESTNNYRNYQCQANYISNIPNLEDIRFKCGFQPKSGSFEWKARSAWFTEGGPLYLQNVTCEPKKRCSAPPLPKDKGIMREIRTRYLIPVTINRVKKAINDFYTGDTVKYSCKPGYDDEPSSSSTSTTAAPATFLKDITCNADGFWNGFPDSELSIGECQAKCAKPNEVQHAVLRDEYANKDKFEEGDKVEYDCELGYTIEGSTRERWCRNTKWTDVHFKCNTILCPTLPQIQHGRIFQDTSDGLANNYESVAEYTCHHGYYLNGNKQLRTVKRTCQSDGKWSGNEPICEVKRKYGCVLPEEPWYGSFIFDDQKRTLRYKCDEGYILTAYRQRDRKCRKGKWTGNDLYCLNLDFTQSKCPELRTPNNGNVYTEGRDIGSKASFTCDEGFVLYGSATRTCQKGRRWDGTMPVCKSRRTIKDIANHLKETMIDSLAGTTTGSKTGAQSRLSPGKSGLDVVLLVDVSSSIGERSMKSAKKFMKLLVDIFGVSNETSGGTNGTRFALITFTDTPTVVFNLNALSARSKSEVKKMIDNIQNTGGGTNFREALTLTFNSQYFKIIYKEERRLTDATRAVFLFTDAEETSTQNNDRIARIRTAAGILKKDGNFEIFCIGVGQNIDHTILAEIASTPQLEHVFTLSKFKDLEEVGDIIAEKNIDYRQCGVSGNTEIARGSQTTNEGAWPWLGWVSVLDDENIPHTCGGAVVCDRWFLTTASCVSRKKGGQVVPYNVSRMNVYLSDYDIFKKDTNEIWPIVHDIMIHDKYTGEEIGNLGIHANDVALLDFGQNETERPVLDKYLRPICIATGNDSLSDAETHFKMLLSFPNKKDAFTAGWGNAPDNIHHTSLLHSKMMQNQRSVVKQKYCKRRYENIDLDRFFCVGEEFEESDSCMGDIGGPYMVQLSNKRFYSLGLALKTRGCKKKNNYSIFLNLLHPTVNDWINRVLDGCNRVEKKDT